MNGLKFRVYLPNGRSEELFIESERALIGSGAHCEVRLPLEHAATEHAVVRLSDAGAELEALAREPLPTINGLPVHRGAIPPGSVVAIGPIRMEIQSLGVGPQARAGGRSEKTNPTTYLMAVVLLVLGFFVISLETRAKENYAAPEAPPLWDAPAATCTQTEPAAALEVARESYARGDAKRERRAFYVESGVEAVPLLDAAAACFRVAGRVDIADQVAEEARVLRTKVEDDYRTHRVRLEHSLAIEDWPVVQDEARVLLAFTAHRGGEYAQWLARLKRKLELKYGGKQK